MDTEQRDELTTKLREIADFYDSISESKLELFPKPYISSYWFQEDVTVQEYKDGEYVTDKQKSLDRLAAIAKALPGKKNKNYTGEEFSIEKDLDCGLTIKWSVSREVTCKKVPTGKTRTIPAYSSPERVEPEYEWVCDEVVLLSK